MIAYISEFTALLLSPLVTILLSSVILVANSLGSLEIAQIEFPKISIWFLIMSYLFYGFIWFKFLKDKLDKNTSQGNYCGE